MAINFPSNPSNGDTILVGTTVYTYDGQAWESSVSPVYISDTAPSNVEEGAFWWNSNNGALYLRYGTLWVQAGTGANGIDGSDGVDGVDGLNASDSGFVTSIIDSDYVSARAGSSGDGGGGASAGFSIAMSMIFGG